MPLTVEQQATNYQTMQHIDRVRHYMRKVTVELLRRMAEHDASKLASPEVEAFTELTPLLADSTYGSPEYKALLERLGPALKHHYECNRHHPEHHANGVNDMDLVDLIEMLCDWKAAGERHKDGSMVRSIKVNTERFGLSPQLVSILEKTAWFLESR